MLFILLFMLWLSFRNVSIVHTSCVRLFFTKPSRVTFGDCHVTFQCVRLGQSDDNNNWIFCIKTFYIFPNPNNSFAATA